MFVWMSKHPGQTMLIVFGVFFLFWFVSPGPAPRPTAEQRAAAKQEAAFLAAVKEREATDRANEARAAREAEERARAPAPATLASARVGGGSGFPVFNGTQPACLNEEALRELLKAFVQKDEVVIRDVERRGVCLMPKAGTRVVILEGIFTMKVRAITDRGSLILWAPVEGISKD